MSQFERLHRINNLIQDRRVISFGDLMGDLEVSRATLKRDIAFLRDRFNAPLVFDRDAGGYRYDKPNGGPRFELPGLWFTSEEILALMTMHQMLESLDTGGLLGPHVKPLMDRLTTMLDSADGSAQEILKRVKLITVQKRRVDPKYFELIGSALVQRRRLVLDYYGRRKDRVTEREVSPLRLVNYRGNWYLDAWCHQSDGIRMFSLDTIRSARVTETKAKEMSLKQVDDELAGGYGIYRGRDLQWATLVFNAEAAKWVRAEIWHEKQQGRELDGGAYELKIPFTEPSELEMDVLRHGENVEVLAPAGLRSQIAGRLAAAARRYRDAG
ncbi:MAG TPA: WYL domain-containing protein [Burkholderiales bacterium]|nr:WYL domain-containing protein [Burkholderiaceae bacterium]HQR53164.1 WYL domain-containing protein [Burkholderiales bacterium]